MSKLKRLPAVSTCDVKTGMQTRYSQSQAIGGPRPSSPLAICSQPAAPRLRAGGFEPRLRGQPRIDGSSLRTRSSTALHSAGVSFTDPTNRSV